MTNTSPISPRSQLHRRLRRYAMHQVVVAFSRRWLSISLGTMRIPHLTTAALMAVFVIGCSKHPGQPISPLPAHTTDLGVVELTDGAPQQFSLGDGKGCTITGKHVSEGMQVNFVIVATNANGTVKLIGTPRLIAPPGQRTALGISDVSIELIPEWKKP